MTAPKFLILDDDLEVIGMASSKADVALFGPFLGKHHVYHLEADIPDREIAGLDRLTKQVTKDAVAKES